MLTMPPMPAEANRDYSTYKGRFVKDSGDLSKFFQKVRIFSRRAEPPFPVSEHEMIGVCRGEGR